MRERERARALSKLMPVKKARAKQFTLIIHLSFFETYETQYIQTHTHTDARAWTCRPATYTRALAHTAAPPTTAKSNNNKRRRGATSETKVSSNELKAMIVNEKKSACSARLFVQLNVALTTASAAAATPAAAAAAATSRN